MQITVLHFAHDYHWSIDGSNPDPRSKGYPSRQGATQAAITACQVRGQKIDHLTGHADRQTCRAHGIRYIDPRRRRVTKAGQVRSDAAFGRKLLARGLRIESPRIAAAVAAEAARAPQPPTQPACPPGPTPPSPPRSGRGAGGEVSNPHSALPTPPSALPLSPAKLAALKKARTKRAIARPRQAPPGYGSVEHFLDTALEYCGRHTGATNALARHLDVDESSVRRWLKREKIPLQRTLDAMALWVQTRKAKTERGK